MTALFRAWRFARRTTLFNASSTADLASRSKALTSYVRFFINTLRLASFGRLCYLTITGLSHFHVAPDATLLFN